MKKRKEGLQDLWDTIKRTNVNILEVTEREEKVKGTETYLMSNS